MKRIAACALLSLACFAVSCRQPPYTVEGTIATDIPLDRLSMLRVRSALSVDPLTFGTEDRPLSLGPGAARVLLPQSFGFRPTSSLPAIAVIDNSEMFGDDPDHPPTLRRVARIPNMMGATSSELLIVLHHGCLATVTPPTGTPACPGTMTSCTVSQWCEGQGLTCGNDGCCRSIDISPSELTIDAGYIEASVPESTDTSPSSCIAFGRPDGGADASTDASTDATTDAPRTDVPGG